MREYQRRRAAAGTSWNSVNRELHNAHNAATRATNSARSEAAILAARARLRPDNLKRCQECKARLPLSDFGDRAMEPDGLRHTCKPCDAKRGNTARLIRAALPSWEERELWACIYCDHPWEHVDHVIPRALGGADDPHNLVPACAECNLSKNDTPVLDWIASRR
ncbi:MULTISPECIES: HNH endonuclease [unclassified Microbacterium]|uniref:HNH endonuclease n=1 Tax=unclassified Microbacterium TaxID=2609290 RepID=UPI0030191710